MKQSPFQTGRTFDPVGRRLAEDILDIIFEDQSYQKFLVEVLIGDREPRELAEDFQARVEAAYHTLIAEDAEGRKKDRGDSRSDQEREDLAFGREIA